jgi:hypothetical protein
MKRETQRITTLIRQMLAIIMLACFGIAQAQTSDEINEAILVDGSIQVTWTNDATNPWSIVDNTMQTPVMTPYSSSTLSFSYTSAYPVEVSFIWYRKYYAYEDQIKFVVDGETISNTIYASQEESFSHIIPAGTHTIEFINESDYAEENETVGGIRKLRVLECKELESGCLKDDSLPLIFTNDPENIWIADDGFIRSTGDKSTISTTFTIDRYSKFNCIANTGDSYYGNNLIMTVDGIEWKLFDQNVDTFCSIVLEPGTHTVEFYRNYNADAVSIIKEVELSDAWIDVTIPTPGSLGREILYKVEYLTDVDLLKITGSLNEDDWSYIAQLTNIQGLDLTDAQIEEIPANAFAGKQYLSVALLPEGLKRIGSHAFSETGAYKVTIPSSVETIESQAWYNSTLVYIDFADNSSLTTIGGQAFIYCKNLVEFLMPDSVTLLDYYNPPYNAWHYYDHFYQCTSLTKIKFSNGLTEIPSGTCNDCTSLKEVILPSNLQTIGSSAFQNAILSSITFPETLESIGDYAFSGNKFEEVTLPWNLSSLGSYAFNSCKNLKTLTLNSHCHDMYSNFNECTALTKVICPSATPPSIESDPFYYVNLKNIDLIVPDFALGDYRLDNYWYNFKTVTSGDEASLADYWAIRGILNLSQERIRQTPDIEMFPGAKLTVSGSAAQPFGDFTYHNHPDNPTAFVSECNAITTSSLTTTYEIPRENEWYFFSPVTDVNISDVTHSATTSFVIRSYDGARRASENATSGNWTNVTSGQLKKGQGYIVQANKAGTLTLPAPADNTKQFLGNDEVTINLYDYSCETPANANWNYIANPYPSYFDVYYIDMEAPITVWTGSSYRAISLITEDGDTYALKPMQPFFVQKPEVGSTAVMRLNGRQVTADINHGSGSGKAPALKSRRSAEAGRQLFNITLTAGNDTVMSDMTRVVLNEKASIAYDYNRDASKFLSMDTSVAQIYTYDEDGTMMAINERPYNNGSVRLGLYTPQAGVSYVVSATRADRKVYLYDAETGVEQDLTAADYVFMAGKEAWNNNRFSLRFDNGNPNSVESVENGVKVAAIADGIAVTAPEGAQIAIANIDGILCATAVATGAELNFNLVNGLYIVTVDGHSYKINVK